MNFFLAARNAGVPITTEIRLFIEPLPRRKISIGVTGTNGKIHYEPAMLGEMRRTTPRKMWLGGNIGKSSPR